MKLRKLIIGYLLVFLTLFGVGILVIQPLAPVAVTVRATPPMVSLEDPPPPEFRVTIKIPASSGYEPEDINASTVRVEGTIEMMIVPDWPKVTKSFFAFRVDGPSLVWAMKHKLPPHADPGAKIDVPLTVTGKFNDNQDFAGTFYVTVLTEHASPPPPPP